MTNQKRPGSPARLCMRSDWASGWPTGTCERHSAGMGVDWLWCTCDEEVINIIVGEVCIVCARTSRHQGRIQQLIIDSFTSSAINYISTLRSPSLLLQPCRSHRLLRLHQRGNMSSRRACKSDHLSLIVACSSIPQHLINLCPTNL